VQVTEVTCRRQSS